MFQVRTLTPKLTVVALKCGLTGAKIAKIANYRHECARRSMPAGIAFTQWSKMGFPPRRGDTHYSDKRDIWHEVADKISRLSGQQCGNIALKLSKFGILSTNLPLGGDSFAQILRNFLRLYASIGSV